MKSLRFSLIALALLMSSVVHAQNGRPVPPRVTLPEAVRRAEAFVAQNGYTNAPPLADHTKLSLEWTNRYVWNLKPDKTWDYDKILSRRKGTVEPTACAWKRVKATQYSQAMWIVVFRTPRSAATGKGRGVYVSERGDEVRMMHENATLKRYEPIDRLHHRSRL